MTTDYEKYPHHDQGLSLAERLHYTINQRQENPTNQTDEMCQLRFSLDRHVRFTGLLVERLEQKGLLSKEEIIELLDTVVTGDLLRPRMFK